MTHVLEFIFLLAVILVAAKLGGLLSSRLGQPAVLGELLAGVILGPTAIDILQLFDSPVLAELLHHLSELGVIVLMFMAGLETDLEDLNRTRATAIIAGVLGVVVPVLMALGVGAAFALDTEHAIFLGLILAATSVSITARTLMELGVLRGRAGISILGAAVVDDVLVILALSGFLALVAGSSDESGVEVLALILGRMLLFFAIAIGIGYKLLPLIGRWVSDLPISENIATFALVVMLLYSWLAEYLGGVALITGSFLAGLLLARTDFRRTIEERVHVLAYAFLVPIFFINIGLTANLRAFDTGDLVLLATLIVVAVVSKLLGCGGGALLSGLPWRESLQVGSGMVSRGEVGLIVASVGVSAGLISNDLFSVFVVVVVVTTLMTPFLLKAVFSGSPVEARHG